ncbi:MAG: hypothetical protein JST10_07815 [Bacteroidetes bacterium]|nr:hypothetical protein [Bacteroidota bacterium]
MTDSETGDSYGFGFVEMPSGEEAKKARLILKVPANSLFS